MELKKKMNIDEIYYINTTYYKFKKDKKFGIMNAVGDILIPAIYNEINLASESDTNIALSNDDASNELDILNDSHYIFEAETDMQKLLITDTGEIINTEQL